MGSRKKIKADKRKEDKKNQFFAVLRNCPTSPRKMRTVVDLIRGKEVYTALNILKFNAKHPSNKLETLLTSAIHNYEAKSGQRADAGNLYVTNVFVDGAITLKRMLPAPQGRAYRMRKRSNHVTLYVGTMEENQQEELQEEGTQEETVK
ncbi:MAG: 50S ribosomal protein L22 [Bacteroidia bacterium]|nr:50S ribosomal protein L22 [Bacteroidia bacterium]